MLDRLKHQPLFLILAGLASLSMLVPAMHAASVENFAVARSFLYTGILGFMLSLVIGLARGTTRPRPPHRDDLGALQALLATFVFLPVLLAVPFHDALRTTTFLNAYFEMVSSLTTTGATLFEHGRLPPSLHLWRAQVAWMGGFLVWVAAAAVMAPLSLGGFEVTAAVTERDAATRLDRFTRAGAVRRVGTFARRLAPVYVGLTGALWLFLILIGDRPFVAVVHAMSTMSTSGISAIGGVEYAGGGIASEMVIFLFLMFGLSRMTFSSDTAGAHQKVWRDPEFRIGIAIAIAVPSLMILRHWIAAFEVQSGEDVTSLLRAFWGGVFTVMSFLTTTGFESAEWDTARSWSGLGTPGMILMGLAMVGGGVATTAGGVKLLRVFALYLAGLRELERLVHPHSIGGSGAMHRRIRRQGALQAWVFFMLFAITLAAATAVLAALGSSFEDSMVMSIAALSTTGPVMTLGAETPINLAALGPWAKSVLCAVMVLGRLELLAIIALMNSDLWRE
ncbi:potassium transporter TrkH [Oceanicola sp. 22II-s10i]|uniref:TrkH family potassium uptake protein n=1 Tax=Oceanicola sp. 22II-s10i TaxID=1317116 RepID=UPI000B52121A|nr:potassium transporter TrkG [Oceanicola sp. 22II-s10i]OWU83587.1 potassium transporter TrkH [Oceanicola sp. 22II-s10i]